MTGVRVWNFCHQKPYWVYYINRQSVESQHVKQIPLQCIYSMLSRAILFYFPRTPREPKTPKVPYLIDSTDILLCGTRNKNSSQPRRNRSFPDLFYRLKCVLQPKAAQNLGLYYSQVSPRRGAKILRSGPHSQILASC
jgi:hypothetical protein